VPSSTRSHGSSTEGPNGGVRSRCYRALARLEAVQAHVSSQNHDHRGHTPLTQERPDSISFYGEITDLAARAKRGAFRASRHQRFGKAFTPLAMRVALAESGRGTKASAHSHADAAVLATCPYDTGPRGIAGLWSWNGAAGVPEQGF